MGGSPGRGPQDASSQEVGAALYADVAQPVLRPGPAREGPGGASRCEVLAAVLPAARPRHGALYHDALAPACARFLDVAADEAVSWELASLRALQFVRWRGHRERGWRARVWRGDWLRLLSGVPRHARASARHSGLRVAEEHCVRGWLPEPRSLVLRAPKVAASSGGTLSEMRASRADEAHGRGCLVEDRPALGRPLLMGKARVFAIDITIVVTIVVVIIIQASPASSTASPLPSSWPLSWGACDP